MRERYLPRRGIGSAARERDRRYRMMRRPKRALGHQRLIAAEQSGYRMYFRGLDRLAECHFGQDRRNPLCKHALPRSRGADHQYIMPSRGGDLDRALHSLLPFDLGKVPFERSAFSCLLKTFAVKAHRLYLYLAVEHLHKLTDRRYRIYLNTFDCRRLRGVADRHVYLAYACFGERHAHTERSFDSSHLARKRNLAYKPFVRQVGFDRSAAAEYSGKYREIVSRSRLLDVRGRQVYKNIAEGKRVSAVVYRRRDPILGFLDSVVRKSDYLVVVDPPADAAFDNYRASVYTEYRR